MSDEKTAPSKLDNLMMAVTFAEAGEHDTALEMMGQGPTKKQQKRIKHRQDKRTGQRPDLRV